MEFMSSIIGSKSAQGYFLAGSVQLKGCYPYTPNATASTRWQLYALNAISGSQIRGRRLRLLRHHIRPGQLWRHEHTSFFVLEPGSPASIMNHRHFA